MSGFPSLDDRHVEQMLERRAGRAHGIDVREGALAAVALHRRDRAGWRNPSWLGVRRVVWFGLVLLATVMTAIIVTVGSSRGPTPGFVRGALAFVRDDGLWVAAPDGSGATEVAETVLGPDEVVDPIQFSFAPDGGSLAFVTTTGTDGASAAGSSLWVVDGPGSPPRALRHDDRWMNVGWSPDGSRIAVTSMAAGRVDLIDRDGTPVGTIDLPAGFVVRDPDLSRVSPLSWSPDGRWIALPGCSGCDWKRDLAYLVVAADGSASHWPAAMPKLPEPNANAAWSPGGRLAVPVGYRVEVHAVDGSTERLELPEGTRSSGWLSWSPDGRRIAITVDSGIVVLADEDGSIVADLPGGVGDLGPVAWSDEGSHLIAMSDALTDGDAALWSVPIAGGVPALLLEGIAGYHFDVN